MTEIFLRDNDEFFHVVFRIQLLFVKWLLADDAIEEVSVLRHAPARRNGQIAFRVDQSIAVGIDRCIEILRNQDFQSIQLPALPFICRESKHGVARECANHIKLHRIQQILIEQPQHLEGLVNPDWSAFETKIVAERSHATDMDAGDGSSTEVDRNRIRFLVTERGNEPFSARRHILQAGHYSQSPLSIVPVHFAHVPFRMDPSLIIANFKPRSRPRERSCNWKTHPGNQDQRLNSHVRYWVRTVQHPIEAKSWRLAGPCSRPRVCAAWALQ